MDINTTWIVIMIFIIAIGIVALFIARQTQKNKPKLKTEVMIPLHSEDKIVDWVRHGYGEAKLLKLTPLENSKLRAHFVKEGIKDSHVYHVNEIEMRIQDHLRPKGRTYTIRGSKEALLDTTGVIKKLEEETSNLRRKLEEKESEEMVRKANKKQDYQEMIELIMQGRTTQNTQEEQTQKKQKLW